MEVVKQAVVDAVLEYYRCPFLFELRSYWYATYAEYSDQWNEIFSQGGGK